MALTKADKEYFQDKFDAIEERFKTIESEVNETKKGLVDHNKWCQEYKNRLDTLIDEMRKDRIQDQEEFEKIREEIKTEIRTDIHREFVETVAPAVARIGQPYKPGLFTRILPALNSIGLGAIIFLIIY